MLRFKNRLRFAVACMVLLALAGCAGKESISARKGYVRFPEKQRTSSKAPVEKVAVGTTIEGEASYYGPGFHGKQTANGEIFDQEDFTCAHKTLPFNTKLKVVRKDNGKSVIVRVNDRGPYVDGRILDLSVAAGRQIGLDKVGHAVVVATVIE